MKQSTDGADNQIRQRVCPVTEKNSPTEMFCSHVSLNANLFSKFCTDRFTS